MAETPVTAPIRSEDVRKRRHWLVDLVVRLVKEKPLATVGASIVLIMFYVIQLIITGYVFGTWIPSIFRSFVKIFRRIGGLK